MPDDNLVRNVSTITVSVMLGIMLTSPRITNLPFHMWNMIATWHKHRKYLRRYALYYRDYVFSPLERWHFSYLASNNILLLCHGRKNGIPVFNFGIGEKAPLIENYTTLTVDIDPNMKPHIVGDVCNPYTYKNFSDKTFNYIVLFNCRCHTYDINDDHSLAPRLRNLLRDDGEIIVGDPDYFRIIPAGFKLVGKPVNISFDKEPHCGDYEKRPIDYKPISVRNIPASRYIKWCANINNEDILSPHHVGCFPNMDRKSSPHDEKELISPATSQGLINLLMDINTRISTFITTQSHIPSMSNIPFSQGDSLLPGGSSNQEDIPFSQGDSLLPGGSSDQEDILLKGGSSDQEDILLKGGSSDQEDIPLKEDRDSSIEEKVTAMMNNVNSEGANESSESEENVLFKRNSLTVFIPNSSEIVSCFNVTSKVP